jgi:hypothetical protein
MSPAKSTSEKIAIFQNLFTGRSDVYGTYDHDNVFQVKKPVNNEVLLDHLMGRKPYGMYMLLKDMTTVLVIDFDDPDSYLPSQFIIHAQNYEFPAYLELSKSKGWHVWIFFGKPGVNAAKARLIASQILSEIEAPENTEIFPKQDRIGKNEFGNFINTPLFGKKVIEEKKTMFVDPTSLSPYPNQWDFLEDVKFVTEEHLDEIIEINGWAELIPETSLSKQDENINARYSNKFQILLPCAKKMLLGVTKFQRLSAFRLAIHFKNHGVPYEIAKEFLKAWSQFNRPINGKSIIRESEIISQLNFGYKEKYTSFGCGEPETIDFCSDQCPLFSKNMGLKQKA